MKMQLGIDLGTTYTVAARLNDDREPAVVRNSDGEVKTPSIVQIRDDETIVGTPAVNDRLLYLDETVERVKRHMGDEDWTVDINGTSYTPEEISARILRKIKTDVEQETGEDVSEVVITVPADFGLKENEATLNAAIGAGFNEESGFDPEEDISLLKEPIAASMRYGADATGETLFVYDLGGGTFDATIVKVAEDEDGEPDYQVVGTEGGQRLGGEDFDDKLYEHIKGDMLDKGYPDPDDNDAIKRDLYKNVRDLKHILSNATEGNVAMNIAGDVYSYEMTRDEFEDLTEPLVTQTFNKVDELFEHENVDAKKEDIDRVLLVGGSTRIKKVQEQVKEYFQMEPSQDLEQDFVVAEGGALATELDIGSRGGVLPKTIGLTIKDPATEELKMEDFMEKNTDAPQTASKRGFYKTNEANRTAKFEILEGEQTLRDADGVRDLGEFKLTDLTQGENPEFEVTYEVDKDGRLRVEAKNLDTRDKENTEVTIGLTEPDDINEGVTKEMGEQIQRKDEDDEDDEDA